MISNLYYKLIVSIKTASENEERASLLSEDSSTDTCTSFFDAETFEYIYKEGVNRQNSESNNSQRNFFMCMMRRGNEAFNTGINIDKLSSSPNCEQQKFDTKTCNSTSLKLQKLSTAQEAYRMILGDPSRVDNTRKKGESGDNEDTRKKSQDMRVRKTGGECRLNMFGRKIRVLKKERKFFVFEKKFYEILLKTKIIGQLNEIEKHIEIYDRIENEMMSDFTTGEKDDDVLNLKSFYDYKIHERVVMLEKRAWENIKKCEKKIVEIEKLFPLAKKYDDERSIQKEKITYATQLQNKLDQYKTTKEKYITLLVILTEIINRINTYKSTSKK